VTGQLVDAVVGDVSGGLPHDGEAGTGKFEMSSFSEQNRIVAHDSSTLRVGSQSVSGPPVVTARTRLLTVDAQGTPRVEPPNGQISES
jgi:hypothetical protein